MTENTSYETSVVSMRTAIAVVCRKYGLDEKDVLEMFEAFDCVAPEQRTKTITTCTSLVKNMLDNKIIRQQKDSSELMELNQKSHCTRQQI